MPEPQRILEKYHTCLIESYEREPDKSTGFRIESPGTLCKINVWKIL